MDNEMMKMLKRMADQMIADGVTAEMFKANMADMTEAYMAHDLKKSQAMTDAYFTNKDFRRSVIIATAEMAVQA